MFCKLKGLLFMGMGIGVVIGALIGQVLWLTFCFGTVVVGIILLFTMPAILIAPAAAGVPAGVLMFGHGFELWTEGVDARPVRSTAEQVALSSKVLENAARLRQKQAALAALDQPPKDDQGQLPS